MDCAGFNRLHKTLAQSTQVHTLKLLFNISDHFFLLDQLASGAYVTGHQYGNTVLNIPEYLIVKV